MVRTHEAAQQAATQCIALRARRLSRLVTRHYEHALRDVGLTATQFTLIGAVAIEQPLSPIDLARMLDLEKSTLSRNLRPLIESKFLISRTRDKGGQFLSLTRKGRGALRRALPEWKKAQGKVMALLGGDVVSRLDGMIAAVADR